MVSPILITCTICGSDKVTRDAWAEWNVDRQKWMLGALFDQGFCHRCEDEQRLVEAPLHKLTEVELHLR